MVQVQKQAAVFVVVCMGTLSFVGDIQVVKGVMGSYIGLFVVYKIGGKLFGSKEAAPAAAAPVATYSASFSSAIPSIADDNFEEWSKAPGNMEKVR